jgi:hypothetical protein
MELVSSSVAASLRAVTASRWTSVAHTVMCRSTAPGGILPPGDDAACGDATSWTNHVHAERVSKATFNGKWPVTVDGGTLACDGTKGDSITFSPDGTGPTRRPHQSEHPPAAAAPWPASAPADRTSSFFILLPSR